MYSGGAALEVVSLEFGNGMLEVWVRDATLTIC